MLLREWQDSLQGAILDAESLQSNLIDALQTGSVDKLTQLGIYGNAYKARLIEALRTNYPALHQLLGDQDFDAMAAAYLEQYPSQKVSIRWFGDCLAVFLQWTDPYSQLPVFAELAAFEWALRHALDAANAAQIGVEELQNIAPENWGDMQFNLHPSVTLLSLQWNAPQIWKALTDNASLPERNQTPMHWLVYRQRNLSSGWRSLSDIELSLLQWVQDGYSFADLCEKLSTITPDATEVPLQAARMLWQWADAGLLTTPNAN